MSKQAELENLIRNNIHTFADEYLELDECVAALTDWHQQEIAKAVNKALVLQFEMDLENLSMHNSLHKLPKEYVVPRKYSLERSIEILKDHKERK